MSLSYKEQLSDPRWQRKRLKILERDKWTCTLCGDNKTTLHIHHEKYAQFAWLVPDRFLHTRCAHCHLLEEYYKKHYSNGTSIFIKVRKRESVGSYLVLYVYRKNEQNVNLLDIFLIDKNNPPEELELKVLFGEKDIYSFIDFIHSLNLPNG